ncbi:MAG: hypothetical protein IK066_03575 [Kiritimatiellae bacterium]|nr:hypothetical protein [Kiritimatiellia bacterium]
MFAPQIKNLVSHGRSWEGESALDAPSRKKLAELFETLDRFEPVGDDNLHVLWLRAPRGPVSAFGDVEEWLEEGEVSSREQFESWWLEEFPREETWFRLSAAEYRDYRTVCVNHRAVIQIDPHKTGEWLDLTEFLQWAIDAAREAADMVANGTYSAVIEAGVAPRDRFGTVAHADFWSVFPEDKADFFKDFPPSDLDAFAAAVAAQPPGDFPKPDARLPRMTANDFYRFCAAGYRACGYPGSDTLSPRELYDANADGRDEGLSEIDPDSPEAFDAWYVNRPRGGHPWEVCRGGNSTHISLCACRDEGGWYLSLAGKSWVRAVETAKFFLALRRLDLPVVLDDAPTILARFRGTDRIGIVPDGIFPRYCESWFPGEPIADFMNLPTEPPDRDAILPHVRWLPLETLRLKSHLP